MVYFNFYVGFYKLFRNEVMFLFNDSKKKDIKWNVIFVKSHLTNLKNKVVLSFCKKYKYTEIFIRCLLQVVQQIK